MVRDHRRENSDEAPEDPAFEKFLGDTFGPLVGFLLGKRVSNEDAQDIAQESQIRLMRYRGQAPDVLKVLLYRIALNLLRDKWRQRNPGGNPPHVVLPLDAHELPAQDPGPDQRAIQQQELTRVREAIARLPQHCRRIYLLNRIEGMSYTEIARGSGVSVKAIEKQMTKALSLLRQELGDFSPNSNQTD